MNGEELQAGAPGWGDGYLHGPLAVWSGLPSYVEPEVQSWPWWGQLAVVGAGRVWGLCLPLWVGVGVVLGGVDGGTQGSTTECGLSGVSWGWGGADPWGKCLDLTCKAPCSVLLPSRPAQPSSLGLLPRLPVPVPSPGLSFLYLSEP